MSVTINGKDLGTVIKELTADFSKSSVKTMEQSFKNRKTGEVTKTQIPFIKAADYKKRLVDVVGPFGFELTAVNENTPIFSTSVVNGKTIVVCQQMLTIFGDDGVWKRHAPCVGASDVDETAKDPENNYLSAASNALKNGLKQFGVGVDQMARLKQEYGGGRNESSYSGSSSESSEREESVQYDIVLEGPLTGSANASYLGANVRDQRTGEALALRIFKRNYQAIEKFRPVDEFLKMMQPGTGFTFLGHKAEYNGQKQVVFDSFVA